MILLASMLCSLLPQRFRGRLRGSSDLGRGAFWSGLVELVVCLGMFCFRYLHFLQFQVGEFAGMLIRHAADEAMGSMAVQFGAGTVTLGEYLFQPLSIMLAYFAIEGAVRLSAAIIQGEAVPSMPLQVAAWAHLWIERRRHHAWLGPKMADEVLYGSGQDFAIRIASCRPKPWNGLTTIAYEDQLFEMFKEEVGQPPRRFIYLLRKAPPHKVVRGLHQYDPEEVVRS